jgi:hypothetical protein
LLESELCPHLITKPPPRDSKKNLPLRPTLAIVPGSGFHHALTELRVAKSPLHGGMGWIKVTP